MTHIQQTLKTMSSNDIELKLKYKRDGTLDNYCSSRSLIIRSNSALVKKRQTSVQSLTKEERIAIVERMLSSLFFYILLNQIFQLN